MDSLFISKTLPLPFTQEELEMHFKRMYHGDKKAREKLIEHNIRLVISIVKEQFGTYPCELKELVAVGCIGLIKSIDTFDIKSKYFKQYTEKCIRNEILMFIRKNKKYLTSSSFDSPSKINEDGKFLKVEETLEDLHSDFASDYEEEETKRVIKEVVSKLNERDKYITIKYFEFESSSMTQKELALKLGISQSYISRNIKRILLKIRDELEQLEVIELSSKDRKNLEIKSRTKQKNVQ